MIEFKYIIAENQESDEGECRIFIFEKGISHDKFGLTLETGIRNESWRNWRRESWRPISAGFTDGKTCYGRSESLDLDSRPEDTNYLLGIKPEGEKSSGY